MTRPVKTTSLLSIITVAVFASATTIVVITEYGIFSSHDSILSAPFKNGITVTLVGALLFALVTESLPIAIASIAAKYSQKKHGRIKARIAFALIPVCTIASLIQKALLFSGSGGDAQIANDLLIKSLAMQIPMIAAVWIWTRGPSKIDALEDIRE